MRYYISHPDSNNSVKGYLQNNPCCDSVAVSSEQRIFQEVLALGHWTPRPMEKSGGKANAGP